MGKKIAIFSDGTGNSAAAVWRTNVWRMFQAVDLSGDNQVAFYDDGVGTSSFKPLAILGGAFGYGLKRNVIDLYKFVCRNYHGDNDEIFGFGFSRGAFTIRIVAGLIFDQGLVQAADEEELDRRAVAAYKLYRQRKFHTFWYELFHRRSRAAPPPEIPDGNLCVKEIRFLGLWDTVAAYGLPVDEMTRGVSKWIWPLELPNRVLSPRVQRACHALALDDERTTFHPVLWDESSQPPPADRTVPRPLSDERISQVWFSGMHSNVGGGYPDDALAYIPLYWIMKEAELCGLKLKIAPTADPDVNLEFAAARDKDGRLYDSRSGAGSYYRYGPRDLAELCHQQFSERPGDRVDIAVPKIHESVFRRIANNAHPCCPLGISGDFDIVSDCGFVVAGPPNLTSKARQHAQERVWDVVWKRRIVYFLTVGVTAYLLIFPLLRSLPRSDEYSSPVRWLSDFIRLIASVLPSIVEPWINGYARSPITFALVAVVLYALVTQGLRLAAEIKSQMGLVWQQATQNSLSDLGPSKTWIFRLRENKLYRKAKTSWRLSVGPALSVIALVYAGATLSSHVLFNVFDDAGFVCTEDGNATKMAQHETRTLTFNSKSVCQNTGIELEEGSRYHIQITQVESTWSDGDISTSMEGYYSLGAPTIRTKLALIFGLPLRREPIRPWFRIVARLGAVGGEEDFLDPDPKDHSIEENLRATKDGELFLFVNDAVIGIPGLFGAFYNNNVGTATVTVTKR